MSTNVDANETRALLDALQPARTNSAPAPSVVLTRDFSRPMRMPSEERERILALLVKNADNLGRALCATLRGSYRFSLTSVEEASAEDAFSDRPIPWAALRFESSGQPGWIFWDTPGALSVLESILGLADPQQVPARELSKVERALLQDLVTPFARQLGELLGASIERLRVVSTPLEAGSWRDAGEKADLQRTLLAFTLHGPVGDSALAVFVPGLSPAGARNPTTARPADLPANLSKVEVMLSAQLESEVPLDELLNLEVGDVIPMTSPGAARVALVVEGKQAAIGALGKHRGQLALKIERVGVPTEGPETGKKPNGG